MKRKVWDLARDIGPDLHLRPRALKNLWCVLTEKWIDKKHTFSERERLGLFEQTYLKKLL